MKKMLLFTIAALLAAQNASAAVITRNSVGELLIEGNLGAEYKNTEVQLQILGPNDENKDLSEIIFDADVNSPVFMKKTYVNTVFTDEQGKYNFVYKLGEQNKYYTAMVSEPGNEEISVVSIYAPSQELESGFLAYVNSADKEKMLEILKDEEYKDILIGNRSDFNQINDEASLKKLAEALSEESGYSSFTEFENKLTLLCAVMLTNSMTDAKEARKLAEDKLNLSESELFGNYNAFSEDIKNRVFERILDMEFDDYDEYMNGFEECIFLECVYGEKYSSNMTELIKSNEKRFDFNLDGYSKYADKVNKNLYGKNFKNMDAFKAELKSELNNAKNNSNNTGSGGNGGGGGGAGSSAGSTSYDIIIPTGNPTKTEVPEKTGYFDDLENAQWAAEAINALAEKGVVAGKGERQFSPMDNIKREEFVRMVVNAFGLEAADGEINFKDVAEDAWYYNDIKIAYTLGIISGTDENNFGTGKLITRQDMAAILYRISEKLEMNFESDDELFADDDIIAGYAKEAVYVLKHESVVSGMGENRFEPLKNATRAQAAKMIFEMINR